MFGAILAMHMGNELLRGDVAGAALVLAGLAVAAASWRVRRIQDIERLPLMGVMGAFVFAAQMINFPLPGLGGVSGHLTGAVLLAILLGPSAAVLVMTAILILQCFLFQDGGLLALGCNVLNMAVAPALLGWGLYRLTCGEAGKAGARRQYLAAWAAGALGVTAGAALAPIEAGLSGVLLIPTAHFLGLMVGVHIVIGLIEGLITASIIGCLRRVRPEVLGLQRPSRAPSASRKFVAIFLLATAMVMSGAGVWFVSTHPDGLEWCWSRNCSSAGPPPSPAEPQVTSRPDVDGWRSLAGVGGTLATLAAVAGAGALLRRRRVTGKATNARQG